MLMKFPNARVQSPTITRTSNEVRLAYIFGFLRFEWLSAQQLAW